MLLCIGHVFFPLKLVLILRDTDYRGDFGRLGHGNSSDLFTPQPIKALHGARIKQIACGDSHCLAVTMDGEVQRLSHFPMFLSFSLSAPAFSCQHLKCNLSFFATLNNQ